MGGGGGNVNAPSAAEPGGGGGDGYGGGGGGGDSSNPQDGGGGGAGGSYSAYSNVIYSTSTSTVGFINIEYTVYSGVVLQYDVSTQKVFYNAKTFVIEHPLQIDKYLVHACLEGPEAGVYYRGTGVITSESKSVEIYLADYVEKLAFDFTIHVTPYLSNDDKEKEPYFPKLITTDVNNGMFTVYSDIVPCKFNYLVFGTRQNIEVEPLKELTYVKGDGPYKWI